MSIAAYKNIKTDCKKGRTVFDNHIKVIKLGKAEVL